MSIERATHRGGTRPVLVRSTVRSGSAAASSAAVAYRALVADLLALSDEEFTGVVWEDLPVVAVRARVGDSRDVTGG